jgi:gliding motility-associated-like protein
MLRTSHITPLLSLIILCGFWLTGFKALAQCDPNVPNLVADLSSSPTATYLSPAIVRNGYCCGVTGNDRCIRFEIYLHPDAQGINFDVCAGAMPTGSLFYQINCGPQTPIGTPICLNGPGPHILTFCKPGNNDNQYCITSIPAPSVGPPLVLNEGCTGMMTSSGFAAGTTTWTSIGPGAIGQYDNYLSCSTCPNTQVSAQPGYPAYVDYRICGFALSPCSQNYYCDTVRVFFNSTLLAQIQPLQPTVCFGAAGTTITAIGSGGTPPYSYQWNTGATSPDIFVGPGTYTVTLSDTSNCPPTTATVIVTQFMQPIQANAGTDIVVCGGSPVAQLNGAVTGVTTGQWSGGAGQFTPSNTSLNATYTATPAEVSAGFVDLTLTTTNNGTCPGHQDVVRVYFDPGITNGNVTAINASCYGAADGSASFTPADPTFTYLWSNGQTSSTATGLADGNYSVTAWNALGCSVTLPVTVGQPDLLAVAGMNVVNETCAGAGNGSATVTVSGGTAPYSYTWNIPGTGPSITAGAGQYTVSITDANGCTSVTATANIAADAQPNSANAGGDVVICDPTSPIQLQGSVTNATGGTWSGGGGTFNGNGLNAQYLPSQSEIQNGFVILTLTTTGNTNCPAASDQVLLSLSNSFINAQLTTTPVTCNGGTNGSVSFFPIAAGSIYTWQGFPQQTGSTLSNVPAGTYTLLVSDQLGCSGSFTAQVYQPAALTVVSTNADAVSCFGGSDGSAGVIVQGGVAPYSYFWGINAGSQTTNPATGIPAGSHTVTIYDANGCWMTGNVTVPTPSQLTLVANVPPTVCVNVPVQLSAVAGGGVGPYDITWPGIGTGANVSQSFTTSGVVTVQVMDANGCAGPVLNLPITVLDLQAATLTTNGDTTVCPGGYSYVSAQLQGYSGTYQMQWPQLGVSGSGPHLVPITQDMTLQVVVTDQCQQALTGVVVLGLETPPNIVLPPMFGQGCAPYTVQFPSNLTDETVTYSWQLGNGGTSNQESPVVTYDEGTYTISLTVTTPLGCSATAENTGQVIAFPPPSAGISADPWITDVDHGTINFTAVIGGNITGTIWTFGDGGISTNTDPSHTYDEIGTYPVTLTVVDANGCMKNAEAQIEITPVYDITTPNIFTPDPDGGGNGAYNPWDLGNDVFYPFIRYVKDYRMRVFNRWGELIFESNDPNRGWDGYYRGQLSPQDVYVYQLWVRFVDGKERQVLGDLTLMR